MNTKSNKVVLLFSLTVFFYILIGGVIDGIRLGKPQELDSIAYHIPIARQFLTNGNLIPLSSPLNYYPAYGEGILSLFLLVNIPWLPNLFNVVVLIPLLLTGIKIAKIFHLPSEYEIVYGTILVTLIPVLRLRSTQDIDIWLLLFFLLSIYFLEKITQRGNSLLACLFLGVLAGTKYTAPFIVFLIGIFYKEKLSHILKNNFFAIIIFLALGLFWYARNFFLTGNPFYPAPLSIGPIVLPGDPSVLSFVGHSPFLELIANPRLWYTLTSALISEFNIWLIVLLSSLSLITCQEDKTRRLLILGMLLIGIYYLSPALIHNAYADLRYTLPGWSLVILVAIKYLYQEKRNWLNVAIALHFFYVAAMVNYYPKALYISLFLSFCTLKVYQSFINKRRPDF